VGGGDCINSLLPLAVPGFTSRALRGEEKDGMGWDMFWGGRGR